MLLLFFFINVIYKMTNLYILFQGVGMPCDEWNTDGKFIQSLKKYGKVYMYENKIYNTAYYDKKNPGRNNYGKDIDFNIDYFDIKKHLEIVYNDIIDTIKDFKKYKWISIGFSLGGHLANAFACIYKCAACVLLDSSMRMLPEFAKKRTEYILKDLLNNKIIKSNKELEEILNKIKTEKNINKYIRYVHELWIYKCTKFTSDNYAGKKLLVPTYSFMNILINDEIIPELKIGKNEELYKNISYLEKDKNYHYVLFVGVGHLIFRNKKEVDTIIKNIINI